MNSPEHGIIGRIDKHHSRLSSSLTRLLSHLKLDKLKTKRLFYKSSFSLSNGKPKDETLALVQSKHAKLETRKVSTDDLVNSMSDVVRTKGVSSDTIRDFLEEKCESIRIGNTDVIFVQQEHTKDLELDPVLKSLAEAPGTKVTLVEYFEPELKANARKFPILGKFLNQMFSSLGGGGIKTNVSNMLAEVARVTGKPIAVADIANKAEYYYGYSLTPTGLLIASGMFPILLPIASIYSVMYGINRIDEFIEKSGLFDPNMIHTYEKMLLDTEDARRVFVAKGVQQLASEYQQRSTEPSRIIACYPRAHTMRIINYLTNQDTLSKASRTAKQSLYRLYPAIDISVRQYRYTDTLARLSGDQSLAGWQRFSNRSL